MNEPVQRLNDGELKDVVETIEFERDDSLPRFPLLTVDEISALPSSKWLIDRVLVKPGFTIIYGPRGSGKSFLALDMSLAIATGRDWHGRPVQKGNVCFIAAEGSAGFAKRVQVWTMGLDADLAEFRLVPVPVNLGNAIDVQGLLTSLRAADFTPDLIVVDTLARCAAGLDENSARDMGRFIAGVDTLQQALSSAVLVVHHSGRDPSHERGSTSLGAAADALLSVTVDSEWDSVLEQKFVRLVCEKSKDDEPFKPVYFALKRVELEDGKTSLRPHERDRHWGVSEREVLRRLVMVSAQVFGTLGATGPELKRAFLESHAKTPHKTYHTAVKDSVERGYMARTGTTNKYRYTITEQGFELVNQNPNAGQCLSMPVDPE